MKALPSSATSAFLMAILLPSTASAGADWAISCKAYARYNQLGSSVQSLNCPSKQGQTLVELEDTSIFAVSSFLGAQTHAAIRAQHSSIGIGVRALASGNGINGALASADSSARVEVSDLVTITSDTLAIGTPLVLTLQTEVRGSLAGTLPQELVGSQTVASASVSGAWTVSGYGPVWEAPLRTNLCAKTISLGTNNCNFNGSGNFILGSSVTFASSVGATFSLLSQLSASALSIVSLSDIGSAAALAEVSSMHSAYVYFSKSSSDFQLISESGYDYFTAPPAIPEPATYLMIVFGSAFVLVMARRRELHKRFVHMNAHLPT